MLKIPRACILHRHQHTSMVWPDYTSSRSTKIHDSVRHGSKVHCITLQKHCPPSSTPAYFVWPPSVLQYAKHDSFVTPDVIFVPFKMYRFTALSWKHPRLRAWPVYVILLHGVRLFKDDGIVVRPRWLAALWATQTHNSAFSNKVDSIFALNNPTSLSVDYFDMIQQVHECLLLSCHDSWSKSEHVPRYDRATYEHLLHQISRSVKEFLVHCELGYCACSVGTSCVPRSISHRVVLVTLSTSHNLQASSKLPYLILSFEQSEWVVRKTNPVWRHTWNLFVYVP